MFFHFDVLNITPYKCCVLVQKLQSAVIIACVEAIAEQQAATPAFASNTSRDTPPFVPKAAQQQVSAAARQLLQQYVQRHAEPLTELAACAFADSAFLQLAEEGVAAARPLCATLPKQIAAVAVEAACLLPSGESLPSGLVRVLLG